MTDNVRPLELLHLAAAKAHATVCLVATSDAQAYGGKRPKSRDVGSTLTRLAVVRTSREYAHGERLTRAQSLVRGNTLASADLPKDASLDEAALVLIEELVRRGFVKVQVAG